MPSTKLQICEGVDAEIGIDPTPEGELATFKLTFPNGETLVLQGDAKYHDTAVLLRHQHPEIGFSLGGLWKGAKKLAGSVASGKVLSLAGKVLSKVAPIMLPGVGSGISLALNAASKLTSAREHAARGNKAAAAALIKSAAADAQTPQNLKTANNVSQQVYALLLSPVNAPPAQA